jgi:hypothetical protein
MGKDDLERRLRDTESPRPPASLRARLEQGIPGSFRQRETGTGARRRWNMVKISMAGAAAAALVWIAVALVAPGSVSVAGVLEPVAAATGNVDTVHVVMQVLSREGEDFEFVDLDAPPMIYDAWIEGAAGGQTPTRARLSKGDRIYACDGESMITYHPQRNEAMKSPGCSIDLEMFWPQAWVRGLLGADPDRVSVVEHQEGSGTGRILIREPGTESTGREPAFLKEFDRETEVTWDLASHRLLTLKRWVLQDGRHMVAEALTVNYLGDVPPETFRAQVPDTVRWVSLRDAPADLASLGPREVTRQFLQAAARADRETLEILGATPHQAEQIAQARVAGVAFVGQPFTAGAYAGVYVPYGITFESGGKKEFRLAVRNDNDQKRWVYDGGF